MGEISFILAKILIDWVTGKREQLKVNVLHEPNNEINRTRTKRND